MNSTFTIAHLSDIHCGDQHFVPDLMERAISEINELEADIVVCTGLFDDTTEGPEDYRDLLASLLRRGVPMVCANPDLVVERGGTMIYCAGAIADAYETMGGAVAWCGKPHRPIYDAALSVAGSLLKRRIEPARVLAIGDSVRTDLAGASALGCGALFIAGGIHAEEFGMIGERAPDLQRIAAALCGSPYRPVGVAWNFCW